MSKMTTKKLGLAIRAARIAKNYTQRELGEHCKWGEEAQSRVSHYENGRRLPTLFDLKTLAKALDVEEAHLIGASESTDIHAILDPEIAGILGKLKPDQKVSVLALMRSMLPQTHRKARK